jgi:hypothetical protein
MKNTITKYLIGLMLVLAVVGDVSANPVLAQLNIQTNKAVSPLILTFKGSAGFNSFKDSIIYWSGGVDTTAMIRFVGGPTDTNDWSGILYFSCTHSNFPNCIAPPCTMNTLSTWITNKKTIRITFVDTTPSAVTNGIINSDKNNFSINVIGNKTIQYKVNAGYFEIKVFNIIGKLLLNKEGISNTPVTNILPFQNSGFYIISLKQGNKFINRGIQLIK